MLNFCTLFDSTYFSRGIVMYESLSEHCREFHLYIFAFDDVSYDTLIAMRLPHITVINLREFEDEELLKVKTIRTRGEYCWTCTPSTVLYIFNNYDVDHCTYIDSDLYFFSSPQPLIDAMGSNSILITPHRYTAQYDQSWKSGIYCVQFVTFKKDDNGLTALNWWRNVCLEWCYNRSEDGKFGDQKYLDDWPSRFQGVYVSDHLGGGVAPWNMQQYIFYKETDDKLMGRALDSCKIFEVIFFHFHSLMFVTPKYFSPRPYYQRNDSTISLLFNPYVKKIKLLREEYPHVKKSERYLYGWRFFKYIAEVFLRRGFKEFRYIKLLHKNG